MKRFAAALIGLSVLVSGLPQGAGAVNIKPTMRAYPVNDTVFEVVGISSAGGGGYWCGAADYAQRVLHADWAAPIYVVRGRGPSVTTGRRSAVQFSLVAPKLPGDPSAADAPLQKYLPFHLLNEMTPGIHMSVQEAMGYCEIARNID